MLYLYLFFVLCVKLCLSNPTQWSSIRFGIQSTIAQSNKSESKVSNHTDSNPCRSVVSFVNGIYHSYTELQTIRCMLEGIFNEEVRVFYNPSTGNWFSDAYRAGVELIYKPNDLLIAKSLALHLQRALKDVGAEGRVLHLAHSGGAIMTYLAARYHLTEQETSRIDIATFGGGRSITRKYFKGGRIVNYYSQNDPLLLVDQRASLLSKLLNDTTKRTVSSDGMNTSYNEIRDIKHNTTFIFLGGLLNNSILDHGMEGPTYVCALRLEAYHHKKRMAQLSTFQEIQKHRFRLVRKKSARITGIHHFWDTIPYSFRSIRKRSANITNSHRFFRVLEKDYWNSTSTSFFDIFSTNSSRSTKNTVNLPVVIVEPRKTWPWS